jgi:hypothetical protein
MRGWQAGAEFVGYAAEDEETKGKHGADDEMRNLANIVKNEGFENSRIWQNVRDLFLY